MSSKTADDAQRILRALQEFGGIVSWEIVEVEEEEEEEDIGLCGSCNIQLDRWRDDGELHRCHNCYWTEKGLDKGVELITPDYRNKNTI